MVKTTIDIPDDKWKKFSIKVIEEYGGRKKNDVIEELIDKYLEEKWKAEEMTFKDFKNKIFRKINKTKEMFIIDYEDTQQEDKFFSDIHLYDDLKQLLSKTLVSKESLNCV